MMSVLVISLVVWLVLVFLSVTGGIERNWINKLTSLHAPLRISPTERYYSSYFYQIDSVASGSNFTLKTIGEKAESALTDPYSAESDMEPPFYWSKPDRLPDGQVLDPVKEAVGILDRLGLPYQDYEIGGALLKLGLKRPEDPGVSYLSQMSYLLSLTDKNPRLSQLIAVPSLADLNHLLAADRSLLQHISIERAKISKRVPFHLLPQNVPMKASLNGTEVILEDTGSSTLVWDGKNLWLDGKAAGLVLRLKEPLELKVDGMKVEGDLQGHRIEGSFDPDAMELVKASAKVQYDEFPSSPPPWAYFVKGHCILPEWGSEIGILLPKTYRDSGARIGDRGHLSYTAPSAASMQEQKIQVRVAGFYDPGILPVGNRCLIVPQEVTRAIYAASQTFSPDGTPTNGIFIWTSDPAAVKRELSDRFDAAGIASFWKISTYEEFEFSKDLMQQFQSDKTLFLLIAAIILIVACCNIISLLVLLVNDKKKEIAILQSMGASFGSIAAIFGFCGISMGLASCLIGSAAAIFTLRHLDILVSFLSALQGHAAFHPAFFGTALPNQLSYDALLFVLIATPLLSLTAGLIPALKASRIRPSSTLRAE